MSNQILSFPHITPAEKAKTSATRFSVLAFAGIFGGLLAIFLGFIFIIVHAAFKGDTIFDEVGTILMMVSIPMLLVGGHFMDKGSSKTN